MNLLKLLFEKKQFVFESAYDLQESICRLQTAVRKESWLPFGKKAGVYGKVSDTKTTLYYFNPRIRNSFMTLFYGQFKVRNGIIVLEGHFSMALFTRIFMGFWFGFLFLSVSATIVQSCFTEQGSTMAPTLPIVGHVIAILVPFLMFCFGIGLVYFGKRLSRGHETHISELIKSVLQAEKRS